MATANIKMSFDTSIERIWNTVTSNTDYSWRSDIDKIETAGSGSHFTEYTKSGFATNFTVTAFEPYKRYEFDMENENMYGHWTGVFTETGGKVQADFTEEVYAKKFFMKPFVGHYLKKQQKQYINDLINVLNNNDSAAIE